MKKSSLTTAVVAGLAGVAGLANVSNAVNLNPDGLGQVLIYPYYGVEGGNATLISVVNTTDSVKAVKVRFLEALNSREVLDFNLYLSPFDVWTGAVSAGATGPGRLTTSDKSCTVPTIPAAGVDFRNFAYTGSFDDDGPNALERTREGHLEMIEMGTVLDTNASFNVATSFYDAAIHIDGTPLGCARLNSSWSVGGQWFNNGTFGANCSTANCGVDNSVQGGLFGGGDIADVANGTSISYNADAVEGFYTLATTTLHTNPGFTFPSLSNAQTSALGEADSVIFSPTSPLGVVTLDFATGRPNAVSSVFMHDAIYNEYNTTDGLLAASEWVITFPTKRLHIEQTTFDRRRPFTDNVDDSDGAGQVTPAGADSVDTLVFDPSGSCEPISLVFFDREEGPEAAIPVVDFSPQPEGEDVGFALCYETNVLTFNQEAAVTAGASEVLGAKTIANNVNLANASGTEVTTGWVGIGLANDVDGDLAIDQFMLDNNGSAVTNRNIQFGLPVTGFWAANYVNTAAQPGLLANFAGTHKHRGSRFARTATVTNEGSATGETIVVTGFAAS
ncbi:MAG: hypothetical protein LKM32_03375 [Chiayiivirga sp.]|jgi:hypothetical protein|uniref:hypothetical protein n=1 Tax=Chiayiivirga sp. TaxID=2041042 RepID=UPI0025C48B23|nr:hypothetical protein [Chiayiivirga sp.]MCI1710691.1 hypothetical protein [Chiayiivirga sp.]MCI1728471.1 hypothetical protein [Chiayiivirga sp.]